MSSFRRPRGRLFRIRRSAAPKLLSPKLLCVRGTANMLSKEDRHILLYKWVATYTAKYIMRHTLVPKRSVPSQLLVTTPSKNRQRYRPTVTVSSVLYRLVRAKRQTALLLDGVVHMQIESARSWAQCRHRSSIGQHEARALTAGI